MHTNERWLSFVRTLKSYFKRHRVRSVILFLSFLFLIALGISCSLIPLTMAPTHNWIAESLQRVQLDDPDHFSFAVFGDNRGSHEIFPRLLGQVSQDPEIHFAMEIGDLVPVGTMEKHRYFISQVQKDLNCPLLAAIGNHELYGEGRGYTMTCTGRSIIRLGLAEATSLYWMMRMGKGWISDRKNGWKGNSRRPRVTTIDLYSCMCRFLIHVVEYTGIVS